MGLALFTLVGLDAQLEEQEPIGALAGCFTNNTADKLLAPKAKLTTTDTTTEATTR